MVSRWPSIRSNKEGNVTQPLLVVEDLRVDFDTPWGVSHALRGVTFAIGRGRILGVVGESGCGKSMTARAIMDIMPPQGRNAGGRILFDGRNLLVLPPKERDRMRGRRISMIFQNPQQALNPVYPIGQQLLWVMQHNGIGRSRAERKRKALTLFCEVGLPQEERILRAYPHQLSGGQQQRVMIAMALATEPELLLADEATTALDVTIQAQILGLLRQLQAERALTIMLITHDMAVVAEACHDVAVLYAGQVVETGTVRDVLRQPQHPYTQGLLAALPHPSKRGADLNVISGVVPGGRTLLSGCAFASRCRQVMEICRQQPPPLVHFPSGSDVGAQNAGSEDGMIRKRDHNFSVNGAWHQAACFLHGEVLQRES